MRYKIILFAGLCLLGVTTTQAQQDIGKIKLSNGTVLKSAVHKIDDDSVYVTIFNGLDLVLPIDSISSIKSGQWHYREAYAEKHGMYYDISLGVIMSKYESGRLKLPKQEVSFSSGYRFKYFFAAGAGFSVQIDNQYMFIPSYLNLKGDFFKKRLTPYYNIDIGKTNTIELNKFNDSEVKGMLFFRPALGLAIHGHRSVWNVGIGYQLLQNEKSYELNWWQERRIVEKKVMRGLRFSISLVI